MLEKTNFREIKRYVQLVENSNISELEITEEGVTLRIKKDLAGTVMNVPLQAAQFSPLANPAPAQAPVLAEKPPAVPASSLLEVKSPMVGTFYQSPSPEAENYVRVGDRVKPGQVLCIVEAMKLMNEIESEFTGTIVEISVENAKPVEFEQTLFRIEKN